MSIDGAEEEVYHVSQVADICGVSKETVRRWNRTGKLNALREENSGYRFYNKGQLLQFEEARLFFEDMEESKPIQPRRTYSLMELFAGAGGLVLGLEKSGLKSVLLQPRNRPSVAIQKRLVRSQLVNMQGYRLFPTIGSLPVPKPRCINKSATLSLSIWQKGWVTHWLHF